jgi:hypothetical protein
MVGISSHEFLNYRYHLDFLLLIDSPIRIKVGSDLDFHFREN